MHLFLNETEARELEQALEIYLSDLHDEIAHTDSREYQEALRASFANLQAIRARLSQSHAEPHPTPPE